jgi:peptide chain release factor 2
VAARPDFWKSPGTAQTHLKKLKQLKILVEPWSDLAAEIADTLELAELVEADEDPDSAAEIARATEALEQKIDRLEFQALLSEEIDINNCYLYIHPGAGGTESCDWAAMLLRMYTRWVEEHGYKVKTLDLQPGDTAGVRSVMLLVEGDYAYGHLKAENGIHRLVRISPFDAASRRHTSFASVYASPVLDENFDVEINEKDLRIDTFRSGGHGGQHVNVTDSAVRIIHVPTGIVVQCQNERSQHQNKAVAMDVLRSRLYQMRVEEHKAEVDKIGGEKKDIAWGHQIRSYVFQPYQMVKDHRTEVETGNVQAVMDGDIDRFIEAYLRSQAGAKK